MEFEGPRDFLRPDVYTQNGFESLVMTAQLGTILFCQKPVQRPAGQTKQKRVIGLFSRMNALGLQN